MKKVVAVMAVASLVLTACIKGAESTNSGGCTPIAESVELPQIKEFIAADSVPFTEDSSGVFYHITTPGTGLQASIYSDIFFTYTSTLLNGSSLGFSTTPVQQPISTAIPGIQAMAGYFKTGTKIQLIVPSSLAYGCQGFQTDSTTVPANSVIYYNLDITEIQ